MFDLRDLYQEVIIDHNRNPRHCHEMDNADAMAEGHNPLCGDKMKLFLKFDGDIISEASFTCKGCAISTASASLMTDTLIGKSREQVQTLFKQFHAMIVDKDESNEKSLGKLTVLAGVKEYPSRVKCATLAWHTLNNALAETRDVATTE